MSQPITLEKTLTINKSAADLYQFWHKFENLPHFMKHLQQVQVYDAQRSHWITQGPLNQSVEWDALITEDRENELISWRSVEDSSVDHAGSIHFQPAPGDRGTRVKIILEYQPPGGVVGDVLSKLFGESPKQQIGDDLRRFKMLMEPAKLPPPTGSLADEIKALPRLQKVLKQTL